MRTDGTDDPGGTSGFRLMNWALGAGRLPPTGMRGPITLGEHRGLQLVARPCNWLIGNVSAETSGSWRAMASSSRSQVMRWAPRAAACLTWEPLSVNVRWCPLLAVVIVTHLDTRSHAVAPTPVGGQARAYALRERLDLSAKVQGRMFLLLSPAARSTQICRDPVPVFTNALAESTDSLSGLRLAGRR
jgi:hypothetical protein